MVIGDRLRALREQKKLSQGDVEKRSGKLRSYIPRVENGHTVPSIETLEKLARALEIPLYQLFYDGEPLLEVRRIQKPSLVDGRFRGNPGKEGRILDQFRKLFNQTNEVDRKLLLYMAQKMAARARHSPKAQ